MDPDRVSGGVAAAWTKVIRRRRRDGVGRTNSAKLDDVTAPGRPTRHTPSLYRHSFQRDNKLLRLKLICVYEEGIQNKNVELYFIY